MNLKDWPSGRSDGEFVAKVDLSPKVEEEMKANDNNLKANGEPNIKDEAEANILAMKLTPSREYQNMMRIQILQPNHLQHNNMVVKPWAVLGI